MRVEASMAITNTNSVDTTKIEGNNQDTSVERIKEVHSNESENRSNREFSENILNKAMEQANKQLNIMNRSIERNVHAKTKTVMYKIIDTNTKEVIREFPPEKIQDMIAKMWELAGLFVDEKA